MPVEALYPTEAFLRTALTQCLNGETKMSGMSVVGGTMFGYMFDVFAWGIVISFLAIVLAFLAEGRGAYAIRLFLGTKSRKEGLDVYSTLSRDEGDWQLLGRLSDIDRVPAERAGLETVGLQRR